MPKSKSITQLYIDFEKAHACFLAVPDTDEKRWQRAVDKCSAIAQQIVRTRATNDGSPAKSVNEMLLKIRVATWAIGGGEATEKLERWRPKPLEYYALASLRDDLKTLANSPL